MNLFKDQTALAVLALLAIATIGGAFMLMRGTSGGSDLLGLDASGLSKKQVEVVVREYILQNPEVLMEAMNNLQAKEEAQRSDKLKNGVAKNSDEIFKSADDHVEGNPNGDVTMVEFLDYRCGYCKKARPDVLKLLSGDKNIRLVVKEFPILGPESEIASRAAIASAAQGKYWEFHLALMAEPALDEATIFELAKSKGINIDKLKVDMKDKRVTAIIDKNHKLAQKMGIDSTPTFIIGGEPIAGAISIDKMKELVANARKAG